MLITTNHLMRYFIYISYLGKAYSGWQVQKNGLAVQQIVEEALSRLLSRRITILGSSRTDKGVHAAQQVAHFDPTVLIDPDDLAYRMNRILPTDIGITAICPVVDGAHARFDASYRKYAYTIVTQKDPFYQDRAVWLRRMPPLTLLNEIAALFCLKADFEFFSKKSDSVNSFVCNVQKAGWQKVDHKMVFEIKANRFLRGMVRSIVGIILKVATRKMALAPLMQLIRLSAKRAYAQEKSTMRPILTLMPPHGLTLMEVGYPETLFLK